MKYLLPTLPPPALLSISVLPLPASLGSSIIPAASAGPKPFKLNFFNLSFAFSPNVFSKSASTTLVFLTSLNFDLLFLSFSFNNFSFSFFDLTILV